MFILVSLFAIHHLLYLLSFNKVEDFAEHDDFFEAKPVRICLMHFDFFFVLHINIHTLADLNQLHDLDEIMKNYSVVMRFTGSRFYATIIEPDATFNDLIPQDYHVSNDLLYTSGISYCKPEQCSHSLYFILLKAFWDNAFDVNRTFVISDRTDRGTPVG